MPHKHIIPSKTGCYETELRSEFKYLHKAKIGSRALFSLEPLPTYKECKYIPYKNVFFEIENGSEIDHNTTIHVVDLIYIKNEENVCDKNFVTFDILHPPRITCHQGSLPLIPTSQSESILIHFIYNKTKLNDEGKKVVEKQYLIPMHGIFDGNEGNTGIGLQHEEFYGFYYVTDKNGYNDLLTRVRANNIVEINFDDDPKIHKLGFWHNQKIEIMPKE